MYDRAAWIRARARKAAEAQQGPIVRHEVRHTRSGTITVPLRSGQKCLWQQVGDDVTPLILQEDTHGA